MLNLNMSTTIWHQNNLIKKNSYQKIQYKVRTTNKIYVV